MREPHLEALSYFLLDDFLSESEDFDEEAFAELPDELVFAFDAELGACLADELLVGVLTDLEGEDTFPDDTPVLLPGEGCVFTLLFT